MLSAQFYLLNQILFCICLAYHTTYHTLDHQSFHAHTLPIYVQTKIGAAAIKTGDQTRISEVKMMPAHNP